MRIARNLRGFRAPRQALAQGGDARGFTLVEMMVVIGIMVIILAMALPAYSSWRERTAALSAADALMAHLKQARIMAVADNRCVEVKFDVAAPYGYTVDVNGPRKLYVPLAQYSKGLKLNTTIAAANKAFVFRSDGTAGTNTCAAFNAALGSVTISAPNGSTHTLTMNGIGRVYMQ